MNKCELYNCELQGLCQVAEISFSDSPEGCEALRAAIKEFGGIDNLYKAIWKSLKKALEEPEVKIEKIQLEPFNSNVLEEGIIFFDNKEKWRENYGKREHI